MNPHRKFRRRQEGYIGVGVRRALGGVSAEATIRNFLASPAFYAPLTTTVVPTRGTGSATFTRATTATVVDFEGLVKNALSGEVRFQGARRVENLIPAAGTGSASLAVSAAKTMTVAVGTYVFSMGAEATGTGVITFTGTATGSTGSLTADATSRTAATLTITGAGTIIATATVQAAVDLQLENVTGQANANPSEYVSVGVLSAPFHGAGIDSVKYFDYENGNTVASNVVTEAQGAAISTSTLLGYLSEQASTNRCLYSQDFSNAAWVASNVTKASNEAVAPDGTTTADTLTATAGNGTVIQDLGVVASAAKNGALWIKRKTGTGNIDLTLDGGATWTTQAVTATWTRFQKNQTLADEDFGIRIVTSGDAVWVWQGQVETLGFGTSDIPTTTVAVTRNADVLTYPTSGNFDNTVGAVYTEIKISTLKNYSVIFAASNASNPFTLVVNEPGFVETYDGTSNVAAITGALSSGVAAKIASSWGGAARTIFANGANVKTGAFDGDYSFGASFAVGGSGDQANGTIRNVKLWTRAASDAAMVRATT